MNIGEKGIINEQNRQVESNTDVKDKDGRKEERNRKVHT